MLPVVAAVDQDCIEYDPKHKRMCYMQTILQHTVNVFAIYLSLLSGSR